MELTSVPSRCAPYAQEYVYSITEIQLAKY